VLCHFLPPGSPLRAATSPVPLPDPLPIGSPRRTIVVSARLRGAYHTSQGVGPGLANLVMGLVFGEWYRRTRRTMPLVIAHTLLRSEEHTSELQSREKLVCRLLLEKEKARR